MELITIGFWILSISAAGMLGLWLLFVESENAKANRFAAASMLVLFFGGVSLVLARVLDEAWGVSGEFFGFDSSASVVIFLVMYGWRTLGHSIKPWLWAVPVLDLLHGICGYIPGFERWEVFTMAGFFFIQLIAVADVFRVIQRQKMHLKMHHADLSHRTLEWLAWLFGAVLLQRFMEWGKFVVEQRFAWEPPGLEMLIEALAVGIVYWIGHNAFAQLPDDELFEAGEQPLNSHVEELNQASEEFDRVLEKIIELKAWRNPDLSLKELARLLEMKERDVSRALNQKKDSSFYRVINDLRVEDFKARMAKGEADEYSIFGLASEVGFKTKTTFYKAFRAKEGLTPGDYLNKLNSSE